MRVFDSQVGASDPRDPSWVRCDISWNTNPDVWEGEGFVVRVDLYAALFLFAF